MNLKKSFKNFNAFIPAAIEIWFLIIKKVIFEQITLTFAFSIFIVQKKNQFHKFSVICFPNNKLIKFTAQHFRKTLL